MTRPAEIEADGFVTLHPPLEPSKGTTMNHPAAINMPVVHPRDVLRSIHRDPVATYRAFRGNHEADELALLPEHMRAGIARYVTCGVKPGSFLRAVFADDFEMAKLRADEDNLAALSAYQNFLENGCPAACWGNPERVQSWVEGGGIVGMMQGAKC